jgi:hypothetical protein
VGTIADAEIISVTGAPFSQLIKFLDHTRWVDHDARANDAGDAGRKDAAWKQGKLVNLIADDNRVTSVRTALVSNDEVVLAGENVDDLALGFVAPLQTNNASAGHNGSSRMCE